MQATKQKIEVPRFYVPRPHQVEAWKRRDSGKYNIYFKIDCRQCVSAGTPVQTDKGLIRFIELKPGMFVKSLDNNGKYTYNKILATMKGANDKPCISIMLGDDYVGTMSYDHRVYYKGEYTQLYRVVWGIMTSHQRHQLRVLCKQYGKSLNLEGLLSQKQMSNTSRSKDRQVCLQGQRLSSGSLICKQKETTLENTQASSRTFYSEQEQSATSKSYRRKHSKQQNRKLRVMYKHIQSKTLSKFKRKIKLRKSKDNTKRIQDNSVDKRKVLHSLCKEIQCNEKQYKICIRSKDLSIKPPRQLYDIEVENTHNFLIGNCGIVCHNSGKDSDDIEYNLDYCWWHRGTQAVYIGLDNVWIKEHIFKKTIADKDGVERRHWDNYPILEKDIRPTDREVILRNEIDMYGNPVDPNSAESRLKFIGLMDVKGVIGSAYRNWTISEASLYPDNAFSYIQPIWENKEAEGNHFLINFNGTPRGIHNEYYNLLCTYTGVTEPELFPGEHGNCYVEKVTIHDLYVPDGKGGYRQLYSPERIEQLKDRIKRQYGNLNLFYQEYECEFLTVKAGLVYQGIELLDKEDRIRNFNLRKDKPVYMAWDIASKGKDTDASTCIVAQYYEGTLFIYDYYEERGMSLIECIKDFTTKHYWNSIRMAALPWDAERSASSMTPAEEATQGYPNIRWHVLERDSVARGIALGRRLLPNLVIHKDNCERLIEAFHNYEYTFIDKNNDWSPKPKHNWASHAMDAYRYMAMFLKEITYLGINADGSYPEYDDTYDALSSIGDEDYSRPKSLISRQYDPVKEDDICYTA